MCYISSCCYFKLFVKLFVLDFVWHVFVDEVVVSVCEVVVSVCEVVVSVCCL